MSEEPEIAAEQSLFFWTCNFRTIHYFFPPANFGTMYPSTWHHIPKAEVVSKILLGDHLGG
jgi:hypothetical protein